MVMQKKNDKWQVYIDFINLDKAYPKDSFCLLKIYMLINATAEHKLLSFMDAYLRYNQILMYIINQEKTFFVTERGIYYYKIILFGLKNARAIYQYLVNKMFSEYLEEIMGVYINDMLVKSLCAVDHVLHL